MCGSGAGAHVHSSLRLKTLINTRTCVLIWHDNIWVPTGEGAYSSKYDLRRVVRAGPGSEKTAHRGIRVRVVRSPLKGVFRKENERIETRIECSECKIEGRDSKSVAPGRTHRNTGNGVSPLRGRQRQCFAMAKFS